MQIQGVKTLRCGQCAGWDWRIVLGWAAKKNLTPRGVGIFDPLDPLGDAFFSETEIKSQKPEVSSLSHHSCVIGCPKGSLRACPYSLPLNITLKIAVSLESHDWVITASTYFLTSFPHRYWFHHIFFGFFWYLLVQEAFQQVLFLAPTLLDTLHMPI